MVLIFPDTVVGQISKQKKKLRETPAAIPPLLML